MILLTDSDERSMRRFQGLSLLVFAGFLAFSKQQASYSSTASDSYVVLKHTTEDNRYVIRHGVIEIQAVCEYSSYTVKGSDDTKDAYCLEPLPLGENLNVKRRSGDLLFCGWERGQTNWNMTLRVEKEEVKK